MKTTYVLGLVAIWTVMLGYGIVYAMMYDATAGTPASKAPSVQLANKGRWTSVMVVHPDCPCSRASLKAMKAVMKEHESELAMHIYFVGMSTKNDSENVKVAMTIPEAEIHYISQVQAKDAFGSFTSGQTFVYGKNGDLVFEGGVTPGRGVDEQRFALDLFDTILAGHPVRNKYKVFGCPLQDVAQ